MRSLADPNICDAIYLRCVSALYRQCERALRFRLLCQHPEELPSSGEEAGAEDQWLDAEAAPSSLSARTARISAPSTRMSAGGSEGTARRVSGPLEKEIASRVCLDGGKRVGLDGRPDPPQWSRSSAGAVLPPAWGPKCAPCRSDGQPHAGATLVQIKTGGRGIGGSIRIQSSAAQAFASCASSCAILININK